VVVIIFSIISCVPASDRKTVVTSPVTVIIPARMKVTQFECFFPYALRGKMSNDNKITTTKVSTIKNLKKIYHHHHHQQW